MDSRELDKIQKSLSRMIKSCYLMRRDEKRLGGKGTPMRLT